MTAASSTPKPKSCWLLRGLVVVVFLMYVLLASALVLLWHQPAGTPLAVTFAITAALALSTLIALLLSVRRLAASNHRLRVEREHGDLMQQGMRESRHRLQLLLDRMPDGVLAFDPQGRIEWINPAARLIFRCSMTDAVGEPVATLIPAIEAIPTPVASAVAPGMVDAQAPRITTPARRRDGTEFTLEIALVPLSVNGVHPGMCVCRDVTDAERVDRMKSEFVSMVSHELRTPLTSLRGSLAILADGSIAGLPPDAMRLLRLANTNAERLVVLVNDILDYEKLRAGALILDLAAIDLSEVARRAIESLEGMARPAGVHLLLRGDDENAPALADPTRFTQVLVNLISNAIKYSPPNGTVRVTIERNDERARLTVRDDGPGVPAEFLPRLFLPFEQARDPKQRKQGGTGLGLAISRGLIEMMNGAIGIDPPTRGCGAAFWIDLPLHSARPSTFGDLID
ncbi:MAG: PAS domain-containing protein [Burkholderiales bacterium]|nr:PAS domain-containing protein [Burkholderiales bacterium]